MKHYQNQ